ncbi:MAG: IS1634 family transposase [Chlorobiales bacterium]|nr:IS1634 family transposase [Chlorobiales bacterium]
MSEELIIETERVDDVPLLLAQLEKMQVALLVDQFFPAHGNWQGLSPGLVCVGWLTHILSQANHRLNHAQGWANQHLVVLEQGLGQAVGDQDFNDDRLARLLDQLSDDEKWNAFEMALGQTLVRVYDLRPNRVRLDSTAASGYAQVTPDGLFQFGHSKDHRPDLPQVKVQLAALDPLGLPLSSTIVSGERADDGLYVPEIKKVQLTLGQHGLLYVGDCKMAALATRAYLAHSHDYYLTPLSQVQCSAGDLRTLLEPVWIGTQTVQKLYQPNVEGQTICIGQGYECSKLQQTDFDGQSFSWEERWLVIQSERLAENSRKGLKERLEKAQQGLAALTERKQGKTCFAEVGKLAQAAQGIIKRYRVEGLLKITCHQFDIPRSVRAYKGREAEIRVERQLSLEVAVEEVALTQALAEMGWRVYATNQSAAELGLNEAVLAYRSEYLIERDFGRLKGRPLSLQPMYLASDQRVKGLLRVLTIGLRVLSLLEFKVRQQLTERGGKLTGLYAGQPKRTTLRPTAERLLEAFENVTLTVIKERGEVRYHLTPLSGLQRRIIELLGFSENIFYGLTFNSSKSVPNIREP